MSEEFQIPDHHLHILRQSGGVPSDKPLPEKTEAKYIELKRCADRANLQLSDRDLVFLSFQMGCGKPTVEETLPPTAYQLWVRGKIKAGAPVEALWRKEKRMGRIRGVTGGGEVKVLLDGEVDERVIPATDVKAVAPAAV